MTERSYSAANPSAASLMNARKLVAARTSPISPIFLTALLVASAGGGLFLALVWATEPEPLPSRTNAAFGICLLIAFSWSTFAAHGLLHRRTLLVHQRMAAASMGLVFSGVFTLFGVAVALAQDRTGGALFVGLTGLSFMIVAALLLIRSHSAKRELDEARAELMAESAPVVSSRE